MNAGQGDGVRESTVFGGSARVSSLVYLFLLLLIGDCSLGMISMSHFQALELFTSANLAIAFTLMVDLVAQWLSNGYTTCHLKR